MMSVSDGLDRLFNETSDANVQAISVEVNMAPETCAGLLAGIWFYEGEYEKAIACAEKWGGSTSFLWGFGRITTSWVERADDAAFLSVVSAMNIDSGKVWDFLNDHLNWVTSTRRGFLGAVFKNLRGLKPGMLGQLFANARVDAEDMDEEISEFFHGNVDVSAHDLVFMCSSITTLRPSAWLALSWLPNVLGTPDPTVLLKTLLASEPLATAVSVYLVTYKDGTWIGPFLGGQPTTALWETILLALGTQRGLVQLFEFVDKTVLPSEVSGEWQKIVLKRKGVLDASVAEAIVSQEPIFTRQKALQKMLLERTK